MTCMILWLCRCSAGSGIQLSKARWKGKSHWRKGCMCWNLNRSDNLMGMQGSSHNLSYLACPCKGPEDMSARSYHSGRSKLMRTWCSWFGSCRSDSWSYIVGKCWSMLKRIRWGRSCSSDWGTTCRRIHIGCSMRCWHMTDTEIGSSCMNGSMFKDNNLKGRRAHSLKRQSHKNIQWRKWDSCYDWKRMFSRWLNCKNRKSWWLNSWNIWPDMRPDSFYRSDNS